MFSKCKNSPSAVEFQEVNELRQQTQGSGATQGPTTAKTQGIVGHRSYKRDKFILTRPCSKTY